MDVAIHDSIFKCAYLTQSCFAHACGVLFCCFLVSKKQGRIITAGHQINKLQMNENNSINNRKKRGENQIQSVLTTLLEYLDVSNTRDARYVRIFHAAVHIR